MSEDSSFEYSDSDSDGIDDLPDTTEESPSPQDDIELDKVGLCGGGV